MDAIIQHPSAPLTIPSAPQRVAHCIVQLITACFTLPVMADALSAPADGGGVVPPPPPNGDDGPSLAGLQPIPTKKTLMVLNSFIINTVDFLNKFNAVSEQKLLQVHHAIQRVEITLALLEGKLDSVAWLSQHIAQHTRSTALGSHTVSSLRALSRCAVCRR